MALVMRPTIHTTAHLLRPVLCGTKQIPPASVRAISYSARRFLQAGSSSHASTALKVEVKEREVDAGPSIVGEEGKGVEGPHYQGAQNTLLDSSQPIERLGHVQIDAGVWPRPLMSQIRFQWRRMF